MPDNEPLVQSLMRGGYERAFAEEIAANKWTIYGALARYFGALEREMDQQLLKLHELKGSCQ